ncbi:glycosyltransferase [Pedobacter ureilyticus]|uniref:Glycosyltransferase n=1 Tax=Pedobacter ureilyticus TaxID=1393051 RepID=A0ABW9J9U1_9SPHI|nr:glycosyltransferase [Pedobacter helvus]
MQYNFAFYIHHHGSGHFMRSLALAKQLEGSKVTLMGSGLERYRHLIPDWIDWFEIPLDLPEEDENLYRKTKPIGLHYAPLNVQGQRQRVRMMTEFFAKEESLILIVDVSVEVAMLATLSGVPYITVRQHGIRNDEPHLIAYANALGLLAPYGSELHSREEDWLYKKTFFSGGFSRFRKSDETPSSGRVVSVLIGNGGTSIDQRLVRHLTSTCPDWHFHIIGLLTGEDTRSEHENVTYHGNNYAPEALLKNSTIILGNAGHNTVMEIASLNRHLIVIPEDRPFQEQRIKSRQLAKMGFATEVDPSMVYEVDWKNLFEELLLKMPNWGGTISENALLDTANYLKTKFSELYFQT